MASDKPTIGIVGFGTFGQFLARRMCKAGYRVLGTSRTSYKKEADEMGAEFYQDLDEFCEQHPDVVILATSILSTESVIAGLPINRLKRSTLFVDVLSVKAYPKHVLKEMLPPGADILCTHPMFGPNSGAGSWEGLNFQYEKVRIADDPKCQARAEAYLDFFRNQGCRMVEMTCEEHDRQAASTQFITHTVGRMLGKMKLESTDINTKGFEALLQLVQQTGDNSFDLYCGLFMFNNNASEELERMEQAFDEVKKQLLGQLHDIARRQLMRQMPKSDAPAPYVVTPPKETSVPASTAPALAAAAPAAKPKAPVQIPLSSMQEAVAVQLHTLSSVTSQDFNDVDFSDLLASIDGALDPVSNAIQDQAPDELKRRAAKARALPAAPRLARRCPPAVLRRAARVPAVAPRALHRCFVL